MPLETLEQGPNIKSLVIEGPKERRLKWDPEKMLPETFWLRVDHYLNTDASSDSVGVIADLQIAAPDKFSLELERNPALSNRELQWAKKFVTEYNDPDKMGLITAIALADIAIAYPKLNLIPEELEYRVILLLTIYSTNRRGMIVIDKVAKAVLIDPVRGPEYYVAHFEDILSLLHEYNNSPFDYSRLQFISDARLVLGDKWIRPPSKLIKEAVAQFESLLLASGTQHNARFASTLAIIMADKVVLQGKGKIQLIYDNEPALPPADALPTPLKF